jgi:hypothetical protein
MCRASTATVTSTLACPLSIGTSLTFAQKFSSFFLVGVVQNSFLNSLEAHSRQSRYCALA